MIKIYSKMKSNEKQGKAILFRLEKYNNNEMEYIIVPLFIRETSVKDSAIKVCKKMEEFINK